MWQGLESFPEDLMKIIPFPMEMRQQKRDIGKKVQGLELFEVLKKNVPNLQVIAEGLGFLTDSVVKLVKDTGFPGMKVLQFAFDGSEDSSYLPHKYEKNCVVYTGTHDNETTKGWLGRASGT